MALHQDLPLVSTIAVGFSAAFVCGLIASRLRLSPIVGYLIAGIIIGPFTPGFTADVYIAEQLSEIGILLLMFGVGLHFSLRDLMSVRRIALPGAVVQIAVATLLGWGVSHYWGWSLEGGLIFGLALSVASTVVLLRALEEHNLLRTNDGNIAIGWLIVEDIAMVLALVMIPALAGDGRADTASVTEGTNIMALLTDLGIALAKVTAFVVFMLVAGKRFLPWLLQTVARERSRELFTLSVFAVAMGVAFGASELFGISFALGAFFAGMMIRESDLSHEAADKALPLQDAFAVLFFVSVGMLFNPGTIIEMPLQVLAVVAIITIGKTIAASAIVILFRYPLRTALVVGASLAQIGEFSFILASLGVAYGLLPESGRDLILAGALISITLNPAFFHISNMIHNFALRNTKYFRRIILSTDDELAHLKKSEKRALKELVILVGHGRVGSHISANIQSAKIELVIIDTNRERVEDLRERGFHAIAADASHEEALRDAAISKAMAIVVAVPNPFEARKIVETARKIRPNIKVLVRAQNDEEMEYFTSHDIDLAVMGEREVARCMVEYINKKCAKRAVR
jgi:CPA2 family monovalent cation:H+ antiporter-2